MPTINPLEAPDGYWAVAEELCDKCQGCDLTPALRAGGIRCMYDNNCHRSKRADMCNVIFKKKETEPEFDSANAPEGYVAVPDKPCVECEFFGIMGCTCTGDQCLADARPDRTRVIFKKKEPNMTDKDCYRQCHNNSGLEVGDRVKVLRKAMDYEQGWANDWAPVMDEFVGQVLTVTADYGAFGFRIGERYCFPWFVLEKQEPEFKELKLESGKTLKVYADKIVCGTDTLAVDKPVFASLHNMIDAIRVTERNPTEVHKLGLLRGHHVRVFHKFDPNVKVTVGCLELTTTECGQVYEMLCQMRKE